MGTAEAMLKEARKSLGTSGRPNRITREYAARHGDYFLDAPWCDMGVTYWARHSGNADAVLPFGDRAYTVWHAQDFQKLNRWYAGTVENLGKARPGDIVFFDWGNSNSVGAIDHVGVIEKVLGGGRVQTIECNTGDACKRRVRGAAEIAGYGRPAYKTYKWGGRAPKSTLIKGDAGDRVRDLQHALDKVGHKLPKFGADGDFGTETVNAVKAFQRAHQLVSSGTYDGPTEVALKHALINPKPATEQEDNDMPRYYGQLRDGAAAITPISIHPGDCKAGIGFVCDNGLVGAPPAALRVAVHDKTGWYSRDLTVDSAAAKPWVKFRDAATTDGISVRREDDGALPVAWDAS